MENNVIRSHLWFSHGASFWIHPKEVLRVVETNIAFYYGRICF